MPAEPTAGSFERLWVEVQGRGGRTPEELKAADLVVVEAGRELPVASLEPAAAQRWARSSEPTRIVLFFDQVSASTGALRRAAEALAPLADELVRLGEVEVVAHDLEPESLLTTRDALALAERLGTLGLAKQGRREVLELRRRTLAEIAAARAAGRPLSEPETVAAVAAAIDEEEELLRRRAEELLTWAAARAERLGAGPRVLVWVSEGFDLDPLLAYAQGFDEAGVRALSPLATRALPLDSAIRDLARSLGAGGWTVFPLALGGDDAAGGFSPGTIDVEDPQGGGLAGTGAGVTLRPGSLFKREKESAEVAPEMVAPREPLERLAEASGGSVLGSEGALRDAFGRLPERFELTYRSALPVGAGLSPLEVRAAGALEVRARRWTSPATPEPVVAARLRRLIEGRELEAGVDAALDVGAAVRLPAGEAPAAAELEARVDLRELAEAPGAAVWRVSTALGRPGREPEVRSEVVAGERSPDLGEWRYRARLDLPADAGRLAVVVEDLATGLWGGTVAAVIEGETASVADLLPSQRVIEIVPPGEEVLRGRVKLETRVFDARVDRVVFLLDDREVEVERRPPFAARIDFGRTPRRQELTVVAYDAAGEELGRHAAVINGGSAGLAVDIVHPEDTQVTGAVDVAAEVAIPIERRLDRVIFYWNAEQVATLYGPPFEQRIYVPPEKPVGYVRVVALLDDGTLAEDVVFMNGPRASERLDVDLVELYVVVTDQDGRPVRGLTREDFRIREEGREQEIATFSDASDLPITLGLAIDSSASMFVKLPNVQRAARRFLRSTFSDQDRAFLVDFDTQPRLARGATNDLERLLRSIDGLEASGRTALWESIVYSLVQLQGVRGRKALVVFSDGADEDDQFPFSSCLRVAKKMGVPIYLILMSREPEPSGFSLLGKPLAARVDRLVETVGGRVFYAKDYDSLDAVYAEIERELRSQYLLAYYPSEGGGGRGLWRGVDVDVLRSGLRPRTLQGYWQ